LIRNKLQRRVEAYQTVYGNNRQDIHNSDAELKRQLQLALAQLPESVRHQTKLDILVG